MKIAIYYDNRFGRNDGPPLYYLNALKQSTTHEIYHLIPQGDTHQTIGPMDLHFWVDWGEDALGYPDWKIPEDGGKKIYIASDTHLDNGYRKQKALEFDHVFFNQKEAKDTYNSRGDNTKPYKNKTIRWLPHAYEPHAYPNIATAKKTDVCFIGHMQEDVPNYNGMSRVQTLDRLFKEFPNFYYGSRNPAFIGKNMFEDAAAHFSQSKIVFNISIRDDVNMRVFETLGTGSFLLTNWLPTLGELFEDGKHLVTYKTYDEMIEKAKYYIEHDEEREAIAAAGYEESKKHTYEERLKTIFKVIGL